MRKRIGMLAVVVAVLAIFGSAWGQGEAEPAAEYIVLDTFGVWRMRTELAPPVTEDGREAEFKHGWMNYRTPPAQEGWTGVEFDDSGWSQGTALMSGQTPMASRVCLRGKFTVTNPAQTRDLQLSVGYKGGVVVYVNGQELSRQHIEAGAKLAQAPAGEARELKTVTIPSRALQRGVNVVGVEIVRAPYRVAADEKPGERVYEAEENGCELLSVRMTAASNAGLIGNAVRPEGVQVWVVDPMREDYDLNFGDHTEAGRPMRITGSRNGLFTGKAVVGSTKTINGLKASVTDLKGEGGATIPATVVRIKFGVPYPHGEVTLANRNNELAPYPTFPELLGGLSSVARDEYPLYEYEPFKA